MFQNPASVTVTIPLKDKTLIQCCFNVGLLSQIVIQKYVYRETSHCVYWAL